MDVIDEACRRVEFDFKRGEVLNEHATSQRSPLARYRSKIDTAKAVAVVPGTVSVGFVEEGMATTSRVISQNLTAGKSFVIPEGL